MNLPDTALVREGRAILLNAAPPGLVNHSVRAYLLGKAYGEETGARFDDEGLYLAALFHDLGLCPAYRDTKHAFQLNSSRALRRFMRERGEARERVEALADAVDFHMQLLPRWSKGNVAGLLQVGAWMDITRLRRWRVRAEAAAAERAYPRLAIERTFTKMLLGSVGGVGSCLGLMFPARESREGR